MNTLLGLLIIAVGSFCQSSSYVPIKKVKEWSWESFWLVQGIFAWLVFPLLGALLAVPAGSSLGEILSTDPSAAFKAAGYGVLWGVGGLTFGLSMRYLGVALGQSIALGTCAGFGTLFPAIFAGENLFAGKGLRPHEGAGRGVAGGRDERLLQPRAGGRAAVAGRGRQRPVPHAARHADGDARGLRDQCRLLPVAECAQPHVRRLRQGVALCQQPAVLNVTFSNLWGIILREWRGASPKTVGVLVCGLAILIFSLVFPNLF